MNCVANGVLLREGIFENLWIQPASGDSGGALGAAFAAYYLMLKKPRESSRLDGMHGAYLGPSFSNEEIEEQLRAEGAVFTKISPEALIDEAAKAIAQGQAVGWHQGRMEFGPRALGARSILANPTLLDTQSRLNLKVKFRESFRPFAPSVLEEDLSSWFNLAVPSPYMLLVAEVADEKRVPVGDDNETKFGIEKLNVARSVIPAVTHVDYSSRVQSVNPSTNPRFYQLIKKFKELTGCPVLVNTSFNVRGEPIVCSPRDAFRCFMATDIDLLVIGDFILHKAEQRKDLKNDYKNSYQLD